MRLLLVLTVACLAQAQSYQPFQRHHFSFGLGAAQPGGDLKAYYQNAFAGSFAYGYRPLRYFQIDAGLDFAYNAAGVNDYYDSGSFGALRIRDFQHYLPFGGRVVLPLASGRVEVYGGGGPVWVRYSELLRQPSDYFKISCPVCSNRDGWGAYAMAGADIALDRGQHFRLGAVAKKYIADTSGRWVGAVAPAGGTDYVKTSDRWLNTYLTFSFSF